MVNMVGMATERELLDELHRRYNNDRYIQRGNGIRWVCAEHVRSDAGFFAQRTADFMAMDMWPGTGNALHGFEVKCSRSDWLRELAAPEKSLPFIEVVDYWWIVAPAEVVRLSELPYGWGLLVPGRSGALRAKRAAERLLEGGGTSLEAHRGARMLPRGFAASLMRAVVKTERRRSSRCGSVEVVDLDDVSV